MLFQSNNIPIIMWFLWDLITQWGAQTLLRPWWFAIQVALLGWVLEGRNLFYTIYNAHFEQSIWKIFANVDKGRDQIRCLQTLWHFSHKTSNCWCKNFQRTEIMLDWGEDILQYSLSHFTTKLSNPYDILNVLNSVRIFKLLIRRNQPVNLFSAHQY